MIYDYMEQYIRSLFAQSKIAKKASSQTISIKAKRRIYKSFALYGNGFTQNLDETTQSKQ